MSLLISTLICWSWWKKLKSEGIKELKSERWNRLTEEQIKLRKHIDEEFIDINQYMMELVENCCKE